MTLFFRSSVRQGGRVLLTPPMLARSSALLSALAVIACTGTDPSRQRADAGVAGRVQQALTAPVLSPEFSIGHPAVGAALTEDQSPGVAFDGTNYFVVWADGSGVGSRVRAARVDSTGVILDSTPLDLAPGAYPKVAFDGTNFYAVQTVYGTNDAGYQISDIYGMRVSPTGQVVDGPTLLSDGTRSVQAPRITRCGANVFAMWSDGTGVVGTRITPSGSFVDAPPIDVAPSFYLQPTATPTGCAVIWPGAGSAPTIARYGATGPSSDPAGIVVASSDPVNQTFPAIASDGTNLLAVWDSGTSTVIPAGVHAARVGPTGAVLDSQPFLVSTGPITSNSRIRAEFDGQDYFVTYSVRDMSATYVEYDLHAARVSSAGILVDSPDIVVSSARRDQAFPFLARGATEMFVVWQDFSLESPTGYSSDIFGARVQGGSVLDANGFLLSQSPSAKSGVSLAWNGTSFFAAFRDNRNASVDGYGMRFAPTGTPLDANDSLLAAQDERPVVAALGQNFLVAWPGLAARVAADGTVLDPAGITLPAQQPFISGRAALACGSSTCLVSWASGTNLYDDQDVEGYVVHTDGTAGSAFYISAANRVQKAPAVASDGTDFVAVWKDCRDGTVVGLSCDGNLYAARIASDGTVLDDDTNAVRIVVSIADDRSPAIAYDPTSKRYLVVWISGATSVTGSVVGARLDTTGGSLLLLDPTPIALASAQENPSEPAVGYTGNGYDFLAAWTVDPAQGSKDVFGTWIRNDGTLPLSDGFYIGNGPQEEMSPAVAAGSQGVLAIAYDTGETAQGYLLKTQGVSGRLVTAPLSNGTSCTSDEPCASGMCRDGVCCDATCTDPCFRCDLAPGTCSAVMGADDTDTCTGTDTCSAQGQCKKKSSQSCSAPTDCASGSCTDGFCCATACDDACDECASIPGTCTIMSKGTVGPTCNPGYACDGLSATCPTRCDIDGDCASQYFCLQNACAAFCVGDSDCTAPSHCDTSTGRCVAGGHCEGDTYVASSGAPESCNRFRCVNGACLDRCVSSADCVAGAVCRSGECGDPLPVAAKQAVGCHSSRAKGTPPPWAILAAIGLVVALRRRRRVTAVAGLGLLGCGTGESIPRPSPNPEIGQVRAAAQLTPTVSPEFLLGLPQLGASDSGGSPFTACDAARCLVVYTETKSAAGRGVFVAADGTISEPGGFPLPGPPVDLALGSSEYLLLYHSGTEIRAARVDVNGALLDPTGFRIGDGSSGRVGFCGTHYFAAFGDYSTVSGVHVDTGGNVVEATPISVATGDLRSVVGRTGECLVAWMSPYPGKIELRGSRVGNQGAPLDSPPIVLTGTATVDAYTRVAIATDGTDYLATWYGYYAGDYALRWSSFLPATGTVLADPTWGHAGYPYDSTLAWDGTQYLAVQRVNSTLVGFHVTTSGATVEPAPIPLFSDGVERSMMDLALGAGGPFLTWQEYNNVLSTRLDSNATVKNDPPLLISRREGFQQSPSVAALGNEFLVAWRDTRNGPPDIYGTRVSSAGVARDPSGIRLAGTTRAESKPALASDGSNYLAAWLYDSNYVVRAMHLHPSGAALDAAPTEFGSGGNFAATNRLAADCAASGCLVAWTAPGGDYRSDVVGALVTSSASVSVTVSTAGEAQQDPAVASNGAGFLVAWTDYRNAIPHIYAGRISGVGASLDGSGIPISGSGDLSEGSVSLTYDEDRQRYVAVWERSGNLHATRLAEQNGKLVVLDAFPGLTISEANGTQSHPVARYARDGHNTLLVWEDEQTTGTRDLFQGWLGDDGTLVYAGSLAASSLYESRPVLSALPGGKILVAYELQPTEIASGAATLAARVVTSSAVDGMVCTSDGECASGRCRDGHCCRSECDTSCETCGAPASPGVCTCTGLGLCHGGQTTCKLSNGQSCASNADCTSDHCVDGNCCESACAELCASCSATPGKCTALPKGALGRVKAIGDGGFQIQCLDGYLCDGVSLVCATSCLTNDECAPGRYCSGGGSCTRYCSSDEECGTNSHCDRSTGRCQTGAICESEHTAISAAGIPDECSPYLCVNGACRQRCESNDECVAGYVCSAGECDFPAERAAPLDPSCACEIGRRSIASRPWTLAVTGLVCVLAIRRRRLRTRKQRGFLAMCALVLLTGCEGRAKAPILDDFGSGGTGGTDGGTPVDASAERDAMPPPDLGASCAQDADCATGFCERGICTKLCSAPADCPPAPEWNCALVPGRGALCACSPTGTEICDGRDNDCNGQIDDGTTCSGASRCNAGRCECAAENDCGGTCVDKQTDVGHCGACDVACPIGAVCTGGVCACPGNGTLCGDACIDTKEDPAHCGSCSSPCAAFERCEDGVCTCANTLCQGVCVSLESDPLHCGRCGHDCVQGQCLSGRCQPVVLVNEEAVAIAVDAQGIYFRNYGGVKRLAADGQSLLTLSTDDTSSGMSGLLAINATGVYWNGLTTIRMAPLDGSQPATTLVDQASLLERVTYLTVNATHLYWISLDSNEASVIKRASLDGTNITVLSSISTQIPTFLHLTSSAMWWAWDTNLGLGGGIDKALLDGTNPTPISSGAAYALTTDGSQVYWSDDAFGYAGTPSISAANLDGSNPTTLANFSAYRLYADGTDLYWSGSGPPPLTLGIHRIPRTGGTITFMVGGFVRYFTGAGPFLYYGSDGPPYRLMRLAK